MVTLRAVLLEPLVAEQWKRIEAYRLAQPERTGHAGGRPQAGDRECLEAILWVVLTGKAGRGWKKLPDKYPSPATCWRRYTEWRASGVWLEEIWNAVAPKALLGVGSVDDARMPQVDELIPRGRR